jgi:hypothetical protein
MINLIENLVNSFPILLTIFLSIIALIVIVRAVFSLLIMMMVKKYQKITSKIRKNFNKKSAKKFNKNDEELFRSKIEFPKIEFPRAHSEVKAELRAKKSSLNNQDNFELIESAEQRMAKEELNKIEIVDFVKPIGFWTSMILGQKLTYLIKSAQSLNKRGDKGFWASMIEAKEREAGRQHSRGR